MNPFIEGFNQWSAAVPGLAWQMFWQSSLLIAVVFLAELVLRRRMRAAIRYTLWLVVLAKLMLPPALALPTSLAWWVRPGAQTRITAQKKVIVTYADFASPAQPLPVLPSAAPPSPRLSASSLGAAGAGLASLSLLGWLIVRWVRVARDVRRAEAPPEDLREALDGAKSLVGSDAAVRLRVTRLNVSPAVCGLFRPIILLPESLARNLPANQLRAVLVHELIHLQRGDVWINCLQTVLQIIYWWHPLVWFANARIRRAREEAVDDSVVLALNDQAECYAPTLLEVAKLAFHRPLASLGLVGILESRSALRQRIERLLELGRPRRTGLSVVSVLGITAFAALAVPMGQAPEQSNAPAIEANKTQAAMLVQDGKLLYELGKLDEAEAKLRDALTNDSENQAAYYYSALVREARMHRRRGMRKADETPKEENGVRHPRMPDDSRIIHTSAGVKATLAKLRQIHLESVQYNTVPLAEVLRVLREEVKRLDPEGVNFRLSSGQTQTAGTIDPFTGLPVSPAVTPTDGAEDISAITIRINPPLKNVSLGNVLDAIVRTADKPIKYSIEDEGVVFSARAANAPPDMYTRVVKVDAKLFIQGLEKVSRLVSGSLAPSSSETEFEKPRYYSPIRRPLMEFLQSRGVNLDPPKMLFINYDEGTLMAHAPLKDLDRFEKVIREIEDNAKVQIEIRVKFIGAPKELADALWTGWELENDPGTRTFSTVLGPAQTKRLLAELEDSPGTEFLSDSSITTLSGRRSEIQVADAKTVVIGVKNGSYESTNLLLGPVLDTTPDVSADGHAIQMTVNATMTEFVGYGYPRPGFIEEAEPRDPFQPLPHFRIREIPTTATIPDGQTLVLGRPTQFDIVMRNGVSSTNQAPEDAKLSLMVLITPTLIDAAGNRVHSEAK